MFQARARNCHYHLRYGWLNELSATAVWFGGEFVALATASYSDTTALSICRPRPDLPIKLRRFHLGGRFKLQQLRKILVEIVVEYLGGPVKLASVAVIYG